MPSAERESMLAHFASCRRCNARLESTESMRRALGTLHRAPLPVGLTERLRVLASHERARRLTRVSFAARLARWSDRASLWFDNLMKPLAFPFAGGLVSSIVIFGLLVPSLMFRHALADTMLFTSPDGQVVILSPGGTYMSLDGENIPRIERADAATPDAANVVCLTIDASGRVSDWSVVRGELTTDLTNIIMFGQFIPATNMGVPISARVKAVQIRSVETPPIRVRS
jgi:hypothetical protein